MHGKTPKLHSASTAVHSKRAADQHAVGHRFRHGHAPTESVGGSKLVLLAVLLVAQLMVILDITAVNIALPSLARDLDISGSSISWTITSYSLIFGSLLLFGGRAADLLGRRRMFLTGLGIFTVSSFASALAGSAGALFAARAGQGLGAAMLSPAALAIIMSAFQGTPAGEGSRRLGSGRRRWCRDRRPRRRRPDRARLAPDLLRQSPRRGGTRDRRAEDHPRRHSEATLEGSRPPRCRARHHESRRNRLRDHPGRERRLDVRPDAPDRPRRPRRARSSSPSWSAAPRPRCFASSGWPIALSAAASS